MEKLGTILTNWKTQEMIFDIGGQPVKLIGDPSLVRAQISLKAMIRTLRKEGGGYWIECNQMDSLQDRKGKKPIEVIPSSLAAVVQQHQSVFQEPTGLPPIRGHEHAIILKEGSNPVSVRPYRYPQCQKNEIERLIAEMLAAGIIKPSTSPF